MKRTLALLLAALLLCFFLPFTAHAASPDITPAFTDPAFLTAVRAVLGKQPTSPITAEDCAAVTMLNLSNKGIADLSGIEYFTGIWLISCLNNEITEINLSRNTSLTMAFCANNPLTTFTGSASIEQLYISDTELTSLNTSGMTGLQQLFCSDNPSLVNLIVSGSKALFQLECMSTGLTTLDVSQNPALEALICSENALATLDVSANTALQALYCGSNQLAALNLANNPQLNDLWCENNFLSVLDISKNPKLNRLICGGNLLTTLDVSGHTLLGTLDCSDNKLSALDVSKHPSLVELDCSGNNLTALNISNSTRLHTLDVRNNFLPSSNAIIGLQTIDPRNFAYEPQKTGGTDISDKIPDENFRAAIREALGKAPGAPITEEDCAWIEKMDVSESNITSLEGIELFTRLKELLCWGNQISKINLQSNTALAYLDCGINNLTSLNVSRNTLLETLCCDDNQLSTLDVSKNTALRLLDVRNNYFASEDKVTGRGISIQEFRFSPQKAFGLDIYASFPDPAFLAAIRATLGKQASDPIYAFECASLTMLSVTGKGITSLAGLERFINLEYLFCQDNKLNEIDLSQNPSLKALACAGNLLTGLDITNNPNLQGLDVSMNWMPSEAAIISLNKDALTYFVFAPQVFSGEIITGKFTDPNFLTAVYAALKRQPGVPIGADDCTAIQMLDLKGKGIQDLSGLEYFTGLFYLDCSDNLLTELDVSRSVKLQVLVCSNNLLDALDLSANEALFGLDCSNNHLASLDFTKNPDLKYLLTTQNYLASEAAILGFDGDAAEYFEFAPQNDFIVTPATCEVQGYTSWTCSHDTPHTHIDQYISALGHDWSDWQTRTAATCEANGLEYRTCARCGAEETRPIDALGHDYQPTVTTPTCTEDGYTTWVCSHNAAHTYTDTPTSALGHDWGDWQTRIAAACEADGLEYRTCARCDAEETRPAAALGHDYQATVTPPTCIEDGYTTWVCSHDVSHTYTDTPKLALGHDWNDWQIRTAATCEADGLDYRTCARCGEEDTRTVAALGHDYQPTIMLPTCTEDGYTLWVCAHDTSHTYTDTPVTALGHVWGEWHLRTAPTCLEKGVEYCVCARCGAEDARDVTALGHDYVATVTPPTYAAKGFTTHTCSHCSDSYKDTYVVKLTLPHDAATNLQYKLTDYAFDTGEGAVTWTSGNGKVLTVNADGSIKYVGRGTTTVTAKDAAGNVIATTTVNVTYVWWQWLIRIFLFGWIWY